MSRQDNNSKPEIVGKDGKHVLFRAPKNRPERTSPELRAYALETRTKAQIEADVGMGVYRNPDEQTQRTSQAENLVPANTAPISSFQK